MGTLKGRPVAAGEKAAVLHGYLAQALTLEGGRRTAKEYNQYAPLPTLTQGNRLHIQAEACASQEIMTDAPWSRD